MFNTYSLCLNIINRNTYGSKEEMANKLDVFLSVDRITSDEYKSLLELLNSK